MFLKKRKAILQRNFGTVPDPMYFAGDMDAIKSYYEFRKDNDLDSFLIDDITWNDLNMDRIFKRINPGLTTSGEQYLYYQLRSPATHPDAYRKRKELLDMMEAFPDLRLQVQMVLAKLGRTRHIDINRTMKPKPHSSKWLMVYIMQILLLAASAAFCTVAGSQGVLAVIAALTLNGIVHEKRLAKCQLDFDTVNYTVSLIFTVRAIRKLKNKKLDQYLEEAYSHLKQLDFAVKTGGVSAVKDGGVQDMLNSVLLLDLIAYEFLKIRLPKYQNEIFSMHETLGKLDAAIAVASYRASLDIFSEPDIDFFPEKPYFHASEMYHPLLKNPVTNSLNTEKSILITGSNASGKSTYLKTAALCALLSQTICTAPSADYRACAFRIFSSMALNDDLLAGESYYIVETKSLKRILNEKEGTVPVLCTIDEVLRGTNTVERIAASSEILLSLAQQGFLCLAATHDGELCDLLTEWYDLYHFEEYIEDNNMLFDYQIRKGRAVSRNAINLLKLIGFDDKIVSGAHNRANRYIESGVWS